MRRQSSSSHGRKQQEKLRRGLWSPEEDEKLYNHMITSYSTVGCWSIVPKQAGLQRCGKSCRLRWINYLRPDLKRGNFTQLEEDLIIRLHEIVGNRWSQIAGQLPGRTDNEIKNYWNSKLKKKLKKMGIDPNTHKPLDERKVHDQELEREQYDLCTPSKPAIFNPFAFEVGFNANIGANMGLYNQFQGRSVGNNSDILDTFLVPNLVFSDDNVSGLSVSYANGETPSNCSNNLSNSLENEEKVVQKNASTAEYTSFESMLAASLDEMFFDISADEVDIDLNLNGDFF